MRSVAKLYISFIGVAAACFVLALPWDIRLALPTDGYRIASLIGVSLLAEAMAIDFRFGPGRQSKSSLAFIPFLSTVILFPPLAAVLAVATVIATSQFVFRRHDFFRGIFNIGQGILSAGVASLIYGVIVNGRIGSPDVPVPQLVVGFFAVAAAFFIVNVFLNTAAISLVRAVPFGTVLEQVAGPMGANLWYDMLGSPVALVLALLDKQVSWAAPIIIVFPLLLIRYSYLWKVQLVEANTDLLKVLVKAIETRDPYTSGHSVRVATLARAIAEDLGLSSKNTRDVETAALLHDIGKIDSMYATVIQKPYDLNADERELIRTHATKGADLLQSLSSLNARVIKAVRHHHERFDGKGYPDGLIGEDIPVAARIIMLCDSVDAMLSDRPYRRALSVEQVNAELIRCSGTQFDPNIVGIMLARNTLLRALMLVKQWGEARMEAPDILTV